MNERKVIWTEEELQQGSQEWLDWRAGGGLNGAEMTLGGSEIAALMYMSPYTTIHNLFREKMGLEEKEFSDFATAAMDRGTLLEPFAREHYEKTEGKSVRTLCAIHPEHSWMRTSLDGITEDNRVLLEIKSPRSWDNHVKQTKSGKVPEYRYPQMQWQLAVMREHFENVERVDYVSFFADVEMITVSPEEVQPVLTNIDMRVIPVYADDAFIKEMMRRAEIFVSYLRAGVAPHPTLFIENLPLVATYPAPQRAKDAAPLFF